MTEKKTHFGRAGEFYAMSELLLRGWNVAVPVVDIGDDVFVIDDNDKTTWRLQVKSCATQKADGVAKVSFSLSRTQLRTPQPIELFYMLLARVEARWYFLLLPRNALLKIREEFVESGRRRKGPGRPPLGDDHAKTDVLAFDVMLAGETAEGWGADLSEYLNRWPDELAPVNGGPGATRKTSGTPKPSTLHDGE